MTSLSVDKNNIQPPFVSVIVLNFNGEKVISLCLERLLEQTYPNFEIIVVDNNSTDKSLESIEPYLRNNKLSVVKSERNRGCPGGRNFGVQYAKGELLAFVDNDGFVHPNWLESAIEPFLSDDTIGAVTSVVLFNRNPAVLNGTGGTVNRLGYGGDHNYHQPIEFAPLPTEVLYPMGCGMLVRRSVLDKIGLWDESLLNYYDDTELGFRVWKIGYRVVVAPGALIYHEFNYSTQFVPSKGLLTEKGRIRTVLKYFPLRYLPNWLMHEIVHLARQTIYAKPQLLAWLWNLRHLSSAWYWRSKFADDFEAFERLLDPRWGWFHFAVPTHVLFQPDLDRLGRVLTADQNTNAQLNYGWFWPEKDRYLSFCWTSERSSAYFRLAHPIKALSLMLKTHHPQILKLVVRSLKERVTFLETELCDFPTDFAWNSFEISCQLPSGDYEFLLHAQNTFTLGRRTVGVGIASIEFH